MTLSHRKKQPEEINHRILSTGYMPEIHIQPLVKKKLIEIELPSLDNDRSYEIILKEALKEESLKLQIIQNIERDCHTYTAIYFDGELIDLEIGNTVDKMYGLAVDIGTTTVVSTLVDLISGEQIASEVAINKQWTYGSDVLSRITHVINNGKEGLAELQRAIVASLDEMLHSIGEKTSISKTSIYQLSIAANTTMTHLLFQIDPTSLGRSPYIPIFTEALDVPASTIGITQVSKQAVVSTLPSVSSFVGSDIVAGVYVSGIHKANNKALLIDVGTNGEIVLSNEGQLISCSCAAGPALEGMNISSGMKASDGAIEDVQITQGGIRLKVIGNVDPVGICGSGVLASLREFIRHGLVNQRGRIIDPETLESNDYRKPYIQANGKKRSIQLTEEVIITQKDIRQIQLTKAAISSGITALLDAKGFESNDIDEIYVAGQFGSHIPEDSFIEIGLFPEAFRGKINYIGNASHSGAYLNLLSKQIREEMQDIAEQIDYIELSVMENYDKLFSKSSQFTYRSEQPNER